MPRKSKRNKSKRNTNTNGSSSQQSQHRTGQIKLQELPEKELTEAFLAFHKLSSLNNSHCSFPPVVNGRQDQEASVPSQRTKSTKSNSTRIFSPRRNRSTGKASSHSGSSKRHSIGRTTTQSFFKNESTRKHVDTAIKKDKTEKNRKEKSDIKAYHGKEQKTDKKINYEKKEKPTIINVKHDRKEIIQRKEKLEKKEKVVVSNEKPLSVIGPILGWEQVKTNSIRGSRPSKSKLFSITRKKEINENSPLANNRFYELSTKTPDDEESRSLRANQGAIPKRKITGQTKDDSIRTILALDAQTNQKKFLSQKQTDLFGTYLNVDGTRSQITNWQRSIDLGPLWEPSSVYKPRRQMPPPRPIVALQTAQSRRNNTFSNAFNSATYNNGFNNHNNSRYNISPASNVSGKVALLRNMYEPGRDIWVNRPEYTTSTSQRCVKILPSHHQCAGPERRLTPNDMDIENIACKLEQHERVPKAGTKPSPCICFRASRRAFCMNCKTHVIGRAYRKCRKHPDIGFSTDHYYCPFCLADALELKEL